jgi:hypothetical protein
VLIDTGVGVSPVVPYPDVESVLALFHSVGREDCLHCGGGHILFDWVPILGNAPTEEVGVTEGCGASDSWSEVLFGGELYVWHCCEHWGDGCSSTSLYNSDDCESVWVSCDVAYQWWVDVCDGEGTG